MFELTDLRLILSFSVDYKDDESPEEQESPAASSIGDSTLQHQPDPSRQLHYSAVQRFGNSCADIQRERGVLGLVRSSLARYEQ